MTISMKCNVLAVKELEVRNGEHKGEKYHVLHAYDGDNLIKVSIPKERVEALKNMYEGKPAKAEITLDLDMNSKKMYFRDFK